MANTDDWGPIEDVCDKISNVEEIATSLTWNINIFGTNHNSLLDTGASISIIQPDLYESIPKDVRPKLESHNVPLKSANGQQIQTYGKLIIPIILGNGKSICHPFVVADVDHPVIIGLDFLLQKVQRIDFEKQMLVINGRNHKFNVNTEIVQTSNVYVAQDTVIPAGTEMLIRGKLKGAGSGDSIYINSDSKFTERTGLLVAQAIVTPKRGRIPLRIMNVGTEEVQLKRGLKVGLGHLVVDAEDTQTNSAYDNSDNEKKIYEDNIPEHLDNVIKDLQSRLTEDQMKEAKAFLIKYQHCFPKSRNDIGYTDVITHSINTGDNTPIKQAPRRIPLSKKEAAYAEIHRMAEADVIEPSNSPWSSPIVLVPKPDGSIRFCVDYRKLNDVTKKDAYPLPRINDTLDLLHGSSYYSTIDLASGFWQVGMDIDAQEKSAFCVPNGLYQFKRMPYGLCNAPATFQRLMEQVLSGLNWEICLLYIDDIIVFSSDFSQHLERLDKVMSRIEKSGLKINPKKCKFFTSEVKFLGHIVSAKGISTDPDKISAVKNWPRPYTVKHVRSFLGICSYYRRFVKDFASIAHPLNQLTEKYSTFHWTPQCEEAFKTLKDKLISPPILAYPDNSKPYILDCDASATGVGAVLSQIDDNGIERVISYYSHSLDKPERNYCVTRRELLAIVLAVKNYHSYLYGSKTTVRTDHGALRWLLNFKNPEGQVARWIERLETYDINIVHRSGIRHGNCDALSRRPCTNCLYCDRLERRDQERTIAGGHTYSRIYALSNMEPWITSPWVKGWSIDELIKWQNEDPNLRKIIQWKTEDNRPLWKYLSGESDIVRILWRHWNNLILDQGVLYRVLDNDKQLVAPLHLQTTVMKYLHTSRLGGHFGIKRTFESINRRVWWPGMRKDIELWCQNCDACQRRNLRMGSAKVPLYQVPVGAPFDRIAMDILSFTETTASGNKCVLVVSDYFTKWAEAYALPDHYSSTIAHVLVTEFFCRYGVPRVIHSDGGGEFRSNLMMDLYKLLEFYSTRTTPYHPQSDGLVERLNRTLVGMLSKFCEDNAEWDQHLPFVMCAYRSTVHSSTGSTPNMLFMGREITLPIDLLCPPKTNPDYICPTSYIQWLRASMQNASEKARIFLKKSATVQKKNYDVHFHVKDRNFEVGSYVLRWYIPNQKASKLNSPWIGPYKVIECPTSVTCRIQRTPADDPITIHINDLKQYHGLSDDDWNTQSLDNNLDISNHESTPITLPRTIIEPNLNTSHNFQNHRDPNYVPLEPVGVINNPLPDNLVPRLRRDRRPPTHLRDYVMDS